jgi:hypothetical protein
MMKKIIPLFYFVIGIQTVFAQDLFLQTGNKTADSLKTANRDPYNGWKR